MVSVLQRVLIKNLLSIILFCFIAPYCEAQEKLNGYVNPFLGTATLWDSIDIGYKPTFRTWGAEVFPGSSLPHTMVQLELKKGKKLVITTRQK